MKPPPPPRHLGLALGLLVPVVVLGLAAGMLLVRDWLARMREATLRAGDVAGAVADRLLLGLNEPGRFPLLVVGPENELLRPPPMDWPPSPAPLPPLEDAALAQAFESARASLARGDWASAGEGYRAFLRLRAAPGLERHRAVAAFEGGISSERRGDASEAVDWYVVALREAQWGAAGESGLPLDGLAALRVLELSDNDPSALLRVWQDGARGMAVWLTRAAPSPALAACVERLRSRVGWDEGAAVLRAYEASSRLRRVHAAATRLALTGAVWPDAFRVAEAGGWLLVRTALPVAGPASLPATSRAYLAVPGDWWERETASVLRQVDPRGVYDCVAEWVGADAAGPRPRAEVVRATRGGAAFRVGAFLRDEAGFRAAQLQRVMVLGALLMGTLVCAGIAVVMTRRALIRQHELNLAKSNFLSAVSHELRTPLGSMRLLAENLDRGTVVGEEKRREYLRLIGDETRRLGTLVENVLDFSRIEQGRKVYEREPTDLGRLVEATVRIMEPLAAKAGVTLALDREAGVAAPEARVDGRAIQQALLNLLDNALKHSPPGARIVVGLGRAGTLARVSVSDSGPGIPAHEQARIFEPFHRLGSELRRETQGVGIGLSLVRHIVEAHGGRVEVASTPGHGATFTVMLPIED